MKVGAEGQVHKASWNAQVIAPGSHVLHAPGLVGTDGQGLDPAALRPPSPMVESPEGSTPARARPV